MGSRFSKRGSAKVHPLESPNPGSSASRSKNDRSGAAQRPPVLLSVPEDVFDASLDASPSSTVASDGHLKTVSFHINSKNFEPTSKSSEPSSTRSWSILRNAVQTGTYPLMTALKELQDRKETKKALHASMKEVVKLYADRNMKSKVRRESVFSSEEKVQQGRVGVFKTLNDYVLLTNIGKGSFSTVKLAVHALTGIPCAVKIISRSLLRRMPTPNDKDQAGGGAAEAGAFNHEIAIMKKLDHPNICKLFAAIDDPDNSKLYLIMEFVEKGSVLQVDADGNSNCPPLSADYIRSVLLDVTSGLDYLHQQQIVHRDIKPENILIDRDGAAKLTDFGVSAEFNKNDHLVDVQGTPRFVAPEALTSDEWSGRAADMWSLGVTVYVMAHGKVPFQARNLRQMLHVITQHKLELDPHLDPDLLDILTKLLVVDPNKRMSLGELLVHPFLGDILDAEPSSTNFSDDMVGTILPGTRVQLMREKKRLKQQFSKPAEEMAHLDDLPDAAMRSYYSFPAKNPRSYDPVVVTDQDAIDAVASVVNHFSATLKLNQISELVAKRPTSPTILLDSNAWAAYLSFANTELLPAGIKASQSHDESDFESSPLSPYHSSPAHNDHFFERDTTFTTRAVPGRISARPTPLNAKYLSTSSISDAVPASPGVRRQMKVEEPTLALPKSSSFLGLESLHPLIRYIRTGQTGLTKPDSQRYFKEVAKSARCSVDVFEPASPPTVDAPESDAPPTSTKISPSKFYSHSPTICPPPQQSVCVHSDKNSVQVVEKPFSASPKTSLSNSTKDDKSAPTTTARVRLRCAKPPRASAIPTLGSDLIGGVTSRSKISFTLPTKASVRNLHISTRVHNAWKAIHHMLPESTSSTNILVNKRMFVAFFLGAAPPNAIHFRSFENFLDILFDVALILGHDNETKSLNRHQFSYCVVLASEFPFGDGHGHVDSVGFLTPSMSSAPSATLQAVSACCDLVRRGVSNPEEISGDFFVRFLLERFASALPNSSLGKESFTSFLVKLFQLGVAMSGPDQINTISVYVFAYLLLFAMEFPFKWYWPTPTYATLDALSLL